MLSGANSDDDSAAPHSTSINAVCSTPDLHWVFSGGSDGYIRKYNWIETANGKSMLTVAQRHPFVDSVTKAGVLTSYWENSDATSGMYLPLQEKGDRLKADRKESQLMMQHRCLLCIP